MCLITEQKEPIKTTEDMVVYKLVKRTSKKDVFRNWSILFYFKYKLNVLYKQKLEVDNVFNCWFDSICGKEYPRGEKWVNIHNGFHSALTEDRLHNLVFSIYCVAKCIIPKGSLIFKDKTGLVVSNKIIIKEVIR